MNAFKMAKVYLTVCQCGEISANMVHFSYNIDVSGFHVENVVKQRDETEVNRAIGQHQFLSLFVVSTQALL